MQKTILRNFILISCVAVLSGASHAIPVTSSSCPQAGPIVTPTNAGGFYMSADCQTAYVLPPDVGIASVVNSLAIADLNACGQIRDYTTAMNKIDDQITDLVGTLNNDAALKGLFSQKQQLMDGFADVQTLGKEQALNINVLFKMNLGQSVQRYKEWNQNAGVNFQSVLLTSLKLYWTSNSPTGGLPAVIDNQVAVDPSGAIGAGGFNARVSLPLATACNLADPFTGMLPANLDYGKVAGALAASITYEYELQSKYSYKASYNLSMLAQEIKNESTQGGFFSSSAMSSLIENDSNTAWFNLNISCDDARVCAQVTIDKMMEIKSDLMKEVLDNIVVSKNGVFQAGGQNPGSISDDGAGKAAKGLHECPNVYCQVAAVVLDVANATFGGTSKTDSYIATHNNWANDLFGEEVPVTFNGNMGFSN